MQETQEKPKERQGEIPQKNQYQQMGLSDSTSSLRDGVNGW